MMILYTVKVSFLARDRERTVPMYIPGIYQNDRDEIKKEQNFHCSIPQKCQKFHMPKIFIFEYLFCSPQFADSKSAIKNCLSFKWSEIF
jgi:hypothetical protein